MEIELKKFRPEIAFMTMEAYFEPHIPTYSGGLGVLAGDILRSCADLWIPTIGIVQASSEGYFRQKLDKNGWQVNKPVYWEPKTTLGILDKKVIIKHRGRDLHIAASPYIIKGETGFKNLNLLVNTNLEENNFEDRRITGMLYDADDKHRIAQENVLGQGGAKLLKELGYKIKKFHLNEGHAAFATLELLAQGHSLNEIRQMCGFTTHTPVSAGHDKWEYQDVKEILGNFLPENIQEVAGRYNLNMTKLALNLSGYVNSVARKHGEVCNQMEVFNGRNVDYVTNGIHPKTWVTESFKDLFDSHFKHWSIEPRVLERADHIHFRELLEAKESQKRHLIGYINSNTPLKFSQDVLTITFARRFATYKRADLILRDIDRLNQIAETKGKFNLVFAGKSHPADDEGKKLIQKIYWAATDNSNNFKTVFLEDYNPEMAKLLQGGSDVWLNNPRRPQEASGTSGMKAALNGCINLSVCDGWIVEGYEMNPNGIYLIGPKSNELTVNSNYFEEDNKDAESLYENLEEILDVYYSDKEEWARKMSDSISLVSYFNTHRVVKEYASKLWNIRV